MQAYVKELRSTPAPPAMCSKYSYACCVSLPRVLYIRDGALFQVRHVTSGLTAGAWETSNLHVVKARSHLEHDRVLVVASGIEAALVFGMPARAGRYFWPT